MTTRREFFKRWKMARENVMAEIHGGLCARGLSTEGFAGGYLQALDDCEGMLRRGYPADHRGYWHVPRALKESK